MNEEEIEFFRAIREESVAGKGNAVRWVYADWLDDNGQPLLAELIRVQCGIEERLFDYRPQAIKERLALQNRERELLFINGTLDFPADSAAGLWQAKLKQLFGDRVELGVQEKGAYFYPLFKGGIPVVAINDMEKPQELPFDALILYSYHLPKNNLDMDGAKQAIPVFVQ